MATITGARDTLNISSDLRDVDMAGAIALLQPDAGPLTTLTKMLNRRSATDPKIQWETDDLDPRYDTVNGAVSGTSATSLVVHNGAYYAEHDFVRNTRTGEVFRVTAVSTNTLTIVRGVGNSGTGVAILDNDELVIIASGQPEGDTSKPARSGNPVNLYNYTQIFRRPWEMTETARNMNIRTKPDDWAYQARKVGIEHKKDIELAFWLGKRDENTGGSHPRRSMGGVFQNVVTNQTDAGGQLTETEWEGAQRGAFRYGSGTKVAFCAPLAISVLNGYAKGRLELLQSDNDQTYGLNVTTMVSPFGRLRLVTHWLFEGAVYGGYIAILDLAQMAYRYLQNRDSHIRQNIQAPDADTRKDEYLCEVTLEYGNEKADALVTGITS